MTIKQWMCNTMILHLPQPHLCPGKLPPKSPSLQGISVLAGLMESWNFRLLNKVFSVTKQQKYLILCVGGWGVKNMNGANVVIMGVFQEDLPQKPGECKHLSSTTLRGKRDHFHMRWQFKGKGHHFSTQDSSSAQITPMAAPLKHFSLQVLGELAREATPVCVHTEWKNSCKWSFLLWD